MKKRKYFFLFALILFLVFLILFLREVKAESLCKLNSGSWGEWSDWSSCKNNEQSRARIENSGCIDIEKRNCTSEIQLKGNCTDSCSKKGEILGACNGNTALRVECGDYNGDGCLEWSDEIYEYCGRGSYCHRGICSNESCNDECLVKDEQKSCINSTAYKEKKCEINNIGCYNWGQWEVKSCKEGERCEEGACTGGVETWVCGEWKDCINGIQRRDCTDVKLTGSKEKKPSEIQECISGIKVNYFPKELNLEIPKSYEQEFSLGFLSLENSQKNKDISIEWFFNSKPLKTDKILLGTEEVSSSFSYNFKESGTVKAEINSGNEMQEVVWNVAVNENAKKDCSPYWNCEWTDCLFDDILSYSYDCLDLNYCGTNINKPYTKKCECYPEWDCTEWSECNVKYGLSDVLDISSNKKGENIINLRGYKEKSCVDLTGCEKNKLKRTVCNISVPISIQKSSWCSQEYLDILDLNTNNLAGRIKKTDIPGFENISRLDISFTQLSGSKEKYCDYCYNGIKDYDETGVDCGGPSCPSCLETKSFFDWAKLMMIFSWAVFALLFIMVIFIEKNKIKGFYSSFSRFEDNLEEKITGIFKRKNKTSRDIFKKGKNKSDKEFFKLD